MSSASVWSPGMRLVPLINANSTLVSQEFTATLSQTLYTLTTFEYVPNVGSLIIFINGVFQRYGTDYVETSSTTFTLAEAPEVGDSVVALGFVGIDADIAVSGADAAFVTYTQAGVGALEHSVRDHLRQEIWSSDFAGTETQKVQRAINFASSVGGGTVIVPRGDFTWGEILIPEKVKLRGQGQRCTRITYNGADEFITLGGIGGSLYYGCGLSDLAIVLTDVASKAVNLFGTAGAVVSNLYIEGPIAASRSNQGIVVDGKNASAFFNNISNVICNHMHIGIIMQSTGASPGTTQPTCQYITNFSSFGDASTDVNSKGIYASEFCGNGTVVTGGNLESCGEAIRLQPGAGSVHWIGIRLEANILDIYLGATPAVQTFSYLTNLDRSRISDNSGTGYERHTYIGCVDVASNTEPRSPFNILPGSTDFSSSGIAATPVVVTGHPGQSAHLVNNRTSSGTVVSGVLADANLFTDNLQFPATQVASGNANCLDDYEEGTWTPVIGGTSGESGQTYIAQFGKYTKIGNKITATCDVYLSAKGVISGAVCIKGLPFVANVTSGSACSVVCLNLATATVAESSYILAAEQFIRLRIKTAAATTYAVAVDADIANNTEIIATVTYIVP